MCRAASVLLPVLALMLGAAASEAGTGIGPAGGEQAAAGRMTPATDDPVRPFAVIERSGLKNVHDLLLERSLYNSFGLFRPRVIGTQNAAFPVDGRPVSDPELMFILESLPISAVERIQILNGSAAALHGGAAIGGAINIVLRRDVQGIEAQTTFHRPTDPGGDGEHASALWGGPLGDGHLLIGVDVFRRAEVRRADRDCSRAAWTPGGSFADTVGVSENGNTVCIPTVSRDGNGNPIQNVANATGLSIACSLGDCRGSSYTGERKADGLDLRARAEWDIDWAALALAPPLAAPQPLRGVDGRREGPGRPPARPGPRVASREPGRPDCTVEPARDLRLREHAGDRPLPVVDGPRRDRHRARCIRHRRHGPQRRGIFDVGNRDPRSIPRIPTPRSRHWTPSGDARSSCPARSRSAHAEAGRGPALSDGADRGAVRLTSGDWPWSQVRAEQRLGGVM